MTIVNNFFKEVGRSAITGGQNHLWAAKNGALLAIAAGIGVAGLTAASSTLDNDTAYPFNIPARILRNETISLIHELAINTRDVTDKIFRAIDILPNKPIIQFIQQTAFALHMASHSFINANVAETMRNIP